MKKSIYKELLRALALRLLVALCLVSVFLFLVDYTSRSVTYEYEDKASLKTGTESSEAKAFSNADPEMRILRITDTDDPCVGIFLTDGTLESCAPIPIKALTEYDIELLKSGVSVSVSELDTLLEETESVIPY